MHGGNTARCPFATALPLGTLAAAAAALLVMSAASRTWAEPVPPTATTSPALADAPLEAPAPIPSPAATLAAYGLVESWIRAGEVPADPAAAGLDAIKDPQGTIGGAAVQLRLAGRLIGRGSAIAGDGAAGGGGVGGGPESVWRAAREAWTEAASRIPRGGGAGLDAEETFRETLRQVMISVELAGPMIAMVPTPATYDEAALSLAPGLDGVAVRFGGAGAGKGEGRAAAIFPGQMLATNTLPGSALAAAASRAGNDATLGLVRPADLVEKHGAALMRFRVSHVAQTGPGSPPVFLDRGGRTIATADLSVAELRATAQRLADHLYARVIGPHRGSDTYEPWRDATGSAELTAMDQALVAAALHAFSKLSHLDPPTRLLRENAAIELEDHLSAMRRLRERSPVEAAIVAALTVGIHDRAAPDADKLLRAVYSPDAGFSPELPPAARAVIAFGLVRAAARPDAAADAIPLAQSAVRAVFRDTPSDRLVAQMPWLGWAELELIDLLRARNPDAPADVPAAIALRRMREQVWEHMVTHADAGGDEQDMVGAIIFTRSRQPIPTWQSARPMAFIATMLGDARLTDPGEVSGEVIRLLTGLRFLRQLQADETAMWMYPSRERALGGIRASLWDQSMPIEASAMTLLAVCQTLESLEKQAARRAAPPPAPAR